MNTYMIVHLHGKSFDYAFFKADRLIDLDSLEKKIHLCGIFGFEFSAEEDDGLDIVEVPVDPIRVMTL